MSIYILKALNYIWDEGGVRTKSYSTYIFDTHSKAIYKAIELDDTEMSITEIEVDDLKAVLKGLL